MEKTKFWKNPALIPKRFVGHGSFGMAVEARHVVDQELHIVKCLSLNKFGSSSFSFKKVTREISHLIKMKSPSLVSYENCWVEDFELPEFERSDVGTDTAEEQAELVQEALKDEPLLRNMKYPTLYIQMERCEPGSDLSSWLKGITVSNKEKEVVHVLMFLTGGLYDLGRRGIVHRDIKPDNVFHTGGAVPLCDWKIGDLGLAVDLQGCYEQTRAGNILYMSPEIAAGKPFNTKADVFSMGLLFLEIVATALLCEGIKARKAFDEIKFAKTEEETNVIVQKVLEGSNCEHQLKKTIVGMLCVEEKRRFTAADVYHRMTTIHSGVPHILEKFPVWPPEFRTNRGGNVPNELTSTSFYKSPSTLFEYEVTFKPFDTSPTNANLSFKQQHSIKFEKDLNTSGWSVEDDLENLKLNVPLPCWNNPVYRPVHVAQTGTLGILLTARHELDRESHDVKCLSLRDYCSRANVLFEEIRKDLSQALKIKSPYVVGHRDCWIEDFALPVQDIADSNLKKTAEACDILEKMENPSLYIVTECTFGSLTLKQWLQDNPSFEQRVAQATEILTNISAGLKHIHEVGIVHKRLSPECIFFDKCTNCWKIGGLSPPLSVEDADSPGEIAEFVNDFRSPEEASLKHLTAKSNVFSMGLIFLLVANPLPNFGMQGIIKKIREEYSGNPAQLLEILGASNGNMSCASLARLIGPMICPTPKDRITATELFQYMFKVNAVSRTRAFEASKLDPKGITKSLKVQHVETECVYEVELKPTFRQLGVGQTSKSGIMKDVRELIKILENDGWNVEINE